MSKEYDYVFKIILLGESGVGKTSILNRYVKNTFNERYLSTIGLDFLVKNINIEGKIIKLQIWDYYTSERFRRPFKTYCREVSGILLVYDLSYSYALGYVESWIRNIKEYAPPDAHIILIGNKYDLFDRKVTEEEGKNIASENQFSYFETSAKTGYNINEAFCYLVNKILQTYKDNNINNKNIQINEQNEKNNNSKGCIGKTKK